MEDHRKTIVGLGEALIDILPDGEVVGGAPLNFSIRVADIGRVLGYSSELVTRVGADSRGERVRDLLAQRQVQTAGLQIDSKHPTGYVDVQLKDGDATYHFGDDVAWDWIDAEPALDLVRKCGVLCFGTLAQRAPASRQAIMRLLEEASEATKLLDLNLRKPLPSDEVIQSSLDCADILKCNDDELQWLGKRHKCQSEELEAIAQELMDKLDLQGVFWTQGASGCVWVGPHGKADVPTDQDFLNSLPREEQADSVGAGDATTAALAIGIMENWEPEKLVDVANKCGAFAAYSRGATAEISEAMVRRLLNLT